MPVEQTANKTNWWQRQWYLDIDHGETWFEFEECLKEHSKNLKDKLNATNTMEMANGSCKMLEIPAMIFKRSDNGGD